MASPWFRIVGDEVPSSSVRSETSPIAACCPRAIAASCPDACRRDVAERLGSVPPPKPRLLELALVEPQSRSDFVDAEARRAGDVLGARGRQHEEGRVYSHLAAFNYNSWA